MPNSISDRSSESAAAVMKKPTESAAKKAMDSAGKKPKSVAGAKTPQPDVSPKTKQADDLAKSKQDVRPKTDALAKSKQADVRPKTKQDVPKIKQADVQKTKQPDVPKVKQQDVPKTKQPDVSKNKQPDAPKTKQPDVRPKTKQETPKATRMDSPKKTPSSSASSSESKRTPQSSTLSPPHSAYNPPSSKPRRTSGGRKSSESSSLSSESGVEGRRCPVSGRSPRPSTTSSDSSKTPDEEERVEKGEKAEVEFCPKKYYGRIKSAEMFSKDQMDDQIPLTDEYKQIIRDTWGEISERVMKQGPDIFIELFKIDKKIMSAYPFITDAYCSQLASNKRLIKHSAKFMQMVQEGINNLDNTEKFYELFINLGKHHINYEALDPNYLNQFSGAMCSVWESDLAELPNTTERVYMAWCALFEIMANLMRHGYSIAKEKADEEAEL